MHHQAAPRTAGGAIVRLLLSITVQVINVMINLIAAVVGSLLFTAAAIAKIAPSSSGAPINLCAANAVGTDGNPLIGAAREAFVKKCVIDAKAVQ